jgi:hypothetical protein
MANACPEALVTSYDGLIPNMKNDEADRHVLAAAVTAGADVIVTENIKHFPIAACEPFGIEIQTADEFLSYWVSPSPPYRPRAMNNGAVGSRAHSDGLLGEAVEEQSPGT